MCSNTTEYFWSQIQNTLDFSMGKKKKKEKKRFWTFPHVRVLNLICKKIDSFLRNSQRRLINLESQQNEWHNAIT